MTEWFFVKCFLLGLSASTALGPIFILTFNHGATRGFLKGFFTGLGSAIGDGLMLCLGFMGMLKILEQSKGYHLAIDCAGGLLLLIFGAVMILKHGKRNPGDVVDPSLPSDSYILTMAKAFLSTVLNPLTLFFFMFVSAQLLPEEPMATGTLVFASALTSLGSLCGLSCVALASSLLGKAMNPSYLRTVSHITGCIVMCIGAYFFFDAIKVILS